MARRRVRNDTDGVVVVGAAAHPFRDAYHRLLTVRWWGAIAAIGAGFLLLNAVFAFAYLLTGGIEGARPGSFADAFFFSAQTLGTIGYGAMHPIGLGANLVAVAESVVSVLFIAVSTGIVFARFSRSSESLMFSDHPCISPMDGLPTLSLRVGNDREGAVMDAQVGITMFRTHRTTEGVTMYRMTDLVLARQRTPALGRTFTVMHFIDEKSPLFGSTPASWQRWTISTQASLRYSSMTEAMRTPSGCESLHFLNSSSQISKRRSLISSMFSHPITSSLSAA